MDAAEKARSTFSQGYFGTPCAAADITRLEVELNEALPPVLRELDFAFDGFCSPKNAPFF